MDSTLLPRHQRPSRLPQFLFGAPYYPEHWTPADREQDPERMAAAGMNVVRMAEFAWDQIEPRRGDFDFSLFDETIARLGHRGIQTILCTPTATPPRWLSVEHENWMRVNSDGHPMTHGSRQHCCTNNPEFRAESERVTRIMAEHYAQNPHVIGWQTDNEFYCHFSECYCSACEREFRQWLARKYRDVATLNSAWGTAFWAQTYDTFEQILLPRQNRPAYPNPSHELDYYRFLSESLCDFQRGQVNVLRGVQPHWWITHNLAFQHLEVWDLAKDLDFLGMDVYPGFSKNHPHDFSHGAAANEVARAASGTYIVPEQQGGAGGQQGFILDTPPPGQMRLWAYQSIAHGADGMLHFRWRTCRFGAEIYWNGILDHDNIPRRRYAEFSQEGAELKRIGSRLLGTVLLTHAAVLIEQEQEDAHATMHMGLPGPKAQRAHIYHDLLEAHLPVGFVHSADSFYGLDLIVIPSFPLMDEVLAAKLRAFVERGGVLVAGARTATRDRNNHVIDRTPPGLLADLFGATVEEFGKLNKGPLTFDLDGQILESGIGYEVLSLRGATALARWCDTADGSPHAAPGQPAVTINRVGEGAAIYVGTYFSGGNSRALLDRIVAEARLSPMGEAEPYVEIICRHAADRRFTFVMNHYGKATQVAALPSGTEILSGARCTGELELAPYGVAIIEHD